MINYRQSTLLQSLFTNSPTHWYPCCTHSTPEGGSNAPEVSLQVLRKPTGSME